MINTPWVTKEDLKSELTGKSIEEQKKIIRRVLQENAIKYKRGLKDKKMPVAQVDDYELEKLEEEINYFLEQQDTSAIKKYEFLSKVKASVLTFSVDEKELIEALCMIDMPKKRPFYMDYLMEHTSIWLNIDCLELIGNFFVLTPEEQETLITLLPKLYKQERPIDNIMKEYFSSLSSEAIKCITSFMISQFETKKALINHLEILTYLSLERKRDPEFMSFVILQKKLQEIKRRTTIDNKVVQNIQRQMKATFDPILQNLSREASIQRSQKILHEKLLEIIESLKQEPKKYISIPLEQLEKLPMNFLMDIINIVMDNNTVAYINLFKKDKETTTLKASLSKDEIEAYSYLKKYYKNGEIIKVPEDIEEFTEALRKTHRTENEIRYLLNQVTSLLEKENLFVEEVVITKEAEEPQENELVYLQSDIGNYYVLKDLEDIPKEYYASFLELLLSIQNNHFKNRKNLTDISKVLEVKNFKTRIIFSRVGQTKYAILGMFMKKVDKDKLQREFIQSRQDQFLRQIETLKNTENETEITELLIAKLNQNEDVLAMSLNKVKKED